MCNYMCKCMLKIVNMQLDLQNLFSGSFPYFHVSTYLGTNQNNSKAVIGLQCLVPCRFHLRTEVMELSLGIRLQRKDGVASCLMRQRFVFIFLGWVLVKYKRQSSNLIILIEMFLSIRTDIKLLEMMLDQLDFANSSIKKTTKKLTYFQS